jgi:hypothetical protein
MDPEIANEELEALLAGHGRDKNLDLTRFVDDLGTAFPAATPAAAAHLAAIAEQTQLLADNGDPVARPASNAVAPVLQASRPPKRWRNSMKDKKARILLKVAAPIVAVFAVLGIMGSAGALPRALQHMTSHAAGFVGLNLPTGEDTDGDGADTTDQGDQNDQGDSTGSSDSSDQGDQNDQGDSTGSSDSSDQGDQNDQGDATSNDTTDQGDQNDQGDSTGSSDSSDQGDQNDQGGSTGTSGGSSDQGDQNDQGDSTGSSGGGSSENDQGDGGSSQDNQGDSSGDSGSGGSGDNQN